MRLLLKILLVTVLVAVGIVAFFWSTRTATISNAMTNMLGVECHIDDLDLRWNRVLVRGVYIGAPAESKISHSFKTDVIDVEVSLWELFFDKHMTVRDINIAGPDIGVELYNRSGSDNNWSRIANHSAAAQETAPAEDADAGTEPGRQLLIKHLLVSDMTVTVAGSPMSSDPITLKPNEDLELHDIGGGEPMPVGQISAIIVRALMKHMTSLEGLGNLTRGVLEVIKDPTNVIKKPLETILPGESSPPVEAIEKGKKVLKGLFD